MKLYINAVGGSGSQLGKRRPDAQSPTRLTPKEKTRPSSTVHSPQSRMAPRLHRLKRQRSYTYPSERAKRRSTRRHCARRQDGNTSSQRNEGRQDSYTKEANISETKDKRQRITLRQRRLLCRRLKSVSSRTGIGLLPEMQAAKSRSCATGQR